MFSMIEDLLDWRSRKTKRVIAEQCTELAEICRALEVPLFGNDGGDVPDKLTQQLSSLAQGFYHPAFDSIGVMLHNVVRNESLIDLVIAHEIIHATGHVDRLNRGFIGLATAAARASVFSGRLPTVEETHSEECVAQYGGMLLLQKLGFHSDAHERDTASYLKRVCKRPDGQPRDCERMLAIRAVKYVLEELEKYRGGKNHADGAA